MSTQTAISPKQRQQFWTDAEAIQRGIGLGRVKVMTATKRLAAGHPVAEVLADLNTADELLFPAQETFRRHATEMAQAGLLERPEGLPERAAPVGDTMDSFAGLMTLDTPDTRELLALLEQAQAVAARVDRARGRHVGDDLPLQPGESAGTDLAESVSILALRVRNEVHGPKGRD